MTSGTWKIPLVALGTAACAESEGANNQSEAGTTMNAIEVGAASGSTATSGGNAAAGAPAEDSSGMPVPGTSTPEHIVVNEDAGNDAR